MTITSLGIISIAKKDQNNTFLNGKSIRANTYPADVALRMVSSVPDVATKRLLPNHRAMGGVVEDGPVVVEDR